MSDLEVLLGDCTEDNLIEYFKKITKPGQIDQVSLEELLLNLPYNYYKVFSHFKMSMYQNHYDFNDVCVVINALNRVNIKSRRTVYNALEMRVTREEKQEAWRAETLMHNAWHLLSNMTKNPINLTLRGSDSGKDEILEEALSELGHRV